MEIIDLQNVLRHLEAARVSLDKADSDVRAARYLLGNDDQELVDSIDELTRDLVRHTKNVSDELEELEREAESTPFKLSGNSRWGN